MRFQKRDIPNTPHRCVAVCVYSKDGICDEPRTNNGNSDAKCFYLTNKAVIMGLIPLTGGDDETVE